MGKASGRRLGPSLDINSSTHPTRSLNPYDPNATPKPSSVLPASGHTSPRLALVPCWLPLPRSCPRGSPAPPRPGGGWTHGREVPGQRRRWLSRGGELASVLQAGR